MNLLLNILNFFSNRFHSRNSQISDRNVNLWFYAEQNLSRWTKTENFANLVPNASASCIYELSRIQDSFAKRSLMSHEYCKNIALPSHACFLFKIEIASVWKYLKSILSYLKWNFQLKHVWVLIGFCHAHEAIKHSSESLGIWHCLEFCLPKQKYYHNLPACNIKTLTVLKWKLY